MNGETIRRTLERHDWRRTAIDVLAAIGSIMLLVHGDDIQQWLRGRGSTPSIVATSKGLPAATVLSVDDQVRTALRAGGQESFAEGTLVCTNGIEVHRPIDMVLPSGQRVAIARVSGTSGNNLDVMVVDADAPGSPYTYGRIRCAFMPSDDAPGSELQYGQIYNFYFTGGDPGKPVDSDTNAPFVDEHGQAVQIGQITPLPGP